MRNRWPLFLSASLAAIFLGKKVLKKEPQSAPNLSDISGTYTGTWQFSNPKEQTQHELTIYPDFSIKIDGRDLKYQMIELTAEKFAMQDPLGYHLIISTNDGQPAAIYDEADDITLPIIPLKEN